MMILDRIKQWFRKDTRCHIFVVEDDAHVRELLAIHLGAMGYRFTMAKDAAQAEALLDHAPDRYALFLLDVKLPGESGIQLARTIRKRSGYANVPILFVTGVFAPSELEKITAQLPHSSSVRKPFTQSQLREAIHGMIPGKKEPVAETTI